MKTIRVKNSQDVLRLLKRLEVGAKTSASDEAKVAQMIAKIRQGGDTALMGYIRKLDGFKIKRSTELRLSPQQIRSAYSKVERGFLRAVQNVKSNVESFQKTLHVGSWRRQIRSGVTLGQRVRPIRRVGIYVPGGEAPLASTVLMTAVPARVAGVSEIALCTPNRGPGIDPRILVAADIAGVTEIYQVGGAQAIAAMAYGTESILRVDKIAGPGSKWVNLAKKRVYGDVGIDSLAGPSEAMIVADESASSVFVAADLLSQAEHSGNETAILVTTSEALAKAVARELALQLKTLGRKRVAKRSLLGGGWIITVKNLEVALEIVNARGPEHLQLMIRNADAYLPKVRAAGAIFVGTHSPVALGDFVAGPSHVLPTGATARFSSGLSLEDFVTKSSIISYSRGALEAAAADVAEFSAAEGLDAHGRSVSLRLAKRGGRH